MLFPAISFSWFLLSFLFSRKIYPKMQNCDHNIGSKIPHFFKIILADTLTQGKIGIPKRYVRMHGKDLLRSSTALLRLPDGTQWQMGLTKSDDTIWLQNGWEEFAQYYSLRQGSFLVFRYDESCCFDVVILDLSASEIDYPHPSSAGVVSRTNGEVQEQAEDAVDDDDDDDVSVEIIGESLHPNRINGTSSDFQNWMEDNAADHRCRGMQGRKSFRRRTREEKAKALGRANGFKSSKPFFQILMYPSYVCPPRGHVACIPADFAKKHISMESGSAVLKLASGRSWKVMYCCFRSKRSRSYFCNGWKKFVMDNNLKADDVCVFEQVNPPALKFEVKIYRV